MQTFAVMPFLGIGQGLQPIVGYNAGIGRTERVHRARNLALRATISYAVTMAAVLAVCAGPLTRFFLTDPATARTAQDALRVLAIALAFSGIAPLASAYFQAIGRPGPSLLLSAGTLVAVKLPLAALLGPHGPTALWWALAAGEALSAVAALAVLRRDAPSRPA
jgi:Na+-driven multidrug efflux pump